MKNIMKSILEVDSRKDAFAVSLLRGLFEYGRVGDIVSLRMFWCEVYVKAGDARFIFGIHLGD